MNLENLKRIARDMEVNDRQAGPFAASDGEAIREAIEEIERLRRRVALLEKTICRSEILYIERI